MGFSTSILYVFDLDIYRPTNTIVEMNNMISILFCRENRLMPLTRSTTLSICIIIRNIYIINLFGIYWISICVMASKHPIIKNWSSTIFCRFIWFLLCLCSLDMLLLWNCKTKHCSLHGCHSRCWFFISVYTALANIVCWREKIADSRNQFSLSRKRITMPTS